MLSVRQQQLKIRKLYEAAPAKKMTKKERENTIAKMEAEMKEAAKALDFERAAELRDLLLELKAEG